MKNLGTDIEPLLFGVKKFKTASILPGMKPLSYNSIAIIDDKDRIIHFCSEDYGLVENRKIIDAIRKKFSDSDIDIVGKSSHSDTRFEFQVIFKKHKLIAGKDPVFPQLSIYNSYNGRTRYSFSGGLYRLVCKNGMVAPIEGAAKSISQIHTPSAEDGLAIQQIESIVELLISKRDELITPIEYLQETPIRHYIERIEDIAKAVGFPASIVEDVIARAEEEAKKLEMTDWIIYNAFNYQLNHNDSIAMAPDKRAKLDKNIFTYIL